MTALGASAAFFGKSLNRKILDGMLGFAAGVMIAASYWSLLAPAIEMSTNSAVPAWIPAVVGFLIGGIVLRLTDRLLPHLHWNAPYSDAEGAKTTWKRTTHLILAITLHNIPESQSEGNTDLATLVAMTGFAVMMTLDVAFG